MVRSRLPLLTPLLALTLVGTTGCDPQDSGDDGGGDGDAAPTCEEASDEDTFAIGLSRAGDGGMMTVEFMGGAPAAPVIRADNVWDVMLYDAAGEPVPGAEMVVTPFMPQHGHGSAVGVEVTDNGDGSYTWDPLYFAMTGLWEITVDVTLPGGDTDTVVFAFCVGA